jgi:hypothetical protein
VYIPLVSHNEPPVEKDDLNSPFLPTDNFSTATKFPLGEDIVIVTSEPTFALVTLPE